MGLDSSIRFHRVGCAFAGRMGVCSLQGSFSGVAEWSGGSVAMPDFAVNGRCFLL